MVDAVRIAEKMTGEANLEITDKMKSQRDFSRSLYVAEDIKRGIRLQRLMCVLFDQDLDFIRNTIGKF